MFLQVQLYSSGYFTNKHACLLMKKSELLYIYSTILFCIYTCDTYVNTSVTIF